MNEVKRINVPQYDEISVKNLWAEVSQDPELMKYFPDTKCSSKLPERDYFFGVLCTLQPEYINSIIDHANKERNSISADEARQDIIVMTEAWYEKLTQLPFISSKIDSL